MSRVFIGIGSNIDPEQSIPKALDLLGQAARILAISTFYRTEPLDRPDQPDFYNGAVLIEIDLPPEDLRTRLHDIEAKLGRQRQQDTYAPRAIDLDILIYDESVPEPDEITTRPFVAIPLAELAPERQLQQTGPTLTQIAARFQHHKMHPLPDFTERLRKETTNGP